MQTTIQSKRSVYFMVGVLAVLTLFTLSACNFPAEQTSQNPDGSMMMEDGAGEWTEEEMEEMGMMESEEGMEGEGQEADYQLNQMQSYNPAAAQQAMDDGHVVLLSFHADWCPTCRANAPKLEAAVQSSGKQVAAFQVNYDTESALKSQFGVTTQSTYILLNGSEEMARFTGLLSDSKLEEWLG